MIKLADFLERTRRELLAATDPTFIHHRQYTRELPSKNMSGARYREVWKVRSGNTWQWEVVFDTASASRPGVSYVQRIALRDLAGMIKAKKTKMPMLDKVRYAINDGDLGMWCSCPAHCLHPDTKIKLLNQEIITIKELVERFRTGEKLYVYSVDAVGNMHAGKVINAWISGRVDKLIRIKLDNGKDVITTLFHRFMLRDGSYKEAHALCVGDSLMPLYFKYVRGYEQVQLNNAAGRKRKAVHTIVAQDFYAEEHDRKVEESGKDFVVVHHKDFNKKNNNPENLEWLGGKEHYLYHAGADNSHTRKNKIRAGIACYKKHPEIYKKWSAAGVARMRTTAGRRQASITLKKLWKEKRDVMISGISWATKTKEFRKLAANKMRETITRLLRDKLFKKKLIARNRIRSITANPMNIELFRLSVGVGHVMAIMKEMFYQYGQLNSDYYITIRDGKKKGFKWEWYFNSFEELEHCFIEIYTDKNIGSVRRRLKNDMLLRIKKRIGENKSALCLVCGNSFVKKWYFQKVCSGWKCRGKLASERRIKMGEQLKQKQEINHKVAGIEPINLPGLQNVYDLSVAGYNNFYVDAGIILHNSYWGYKYINTKLGTNVMGTKENRPPNIRNPQRRGIMCKHLNLSLSVLPANASTITRDIKKKLGESVGMDRLAGIVEGIYYRRSTY